MWLNTIAARQTSCDGGRGSCGAVQSAAPPTKLERRTAQIAALLRMPVTRQINRPAQQAFLW